MEDISLAEMARYLLGAGLVNSFILATAENPETSQNIQDGTLSFLFLQPISPYGVWFLPDLGGKTFNFSLGLAGYAVIFFFFRQYLFLPPFGSYLLLFVLSLFLAALLQFLLFEALSRLSFWVENTYGIRFTMRVTLEVLGGSIIPVSLFPTIFHSFLILLPFQYLIYLPMEIYLGNITIIIAQIPSQVLMGTLSFKSVFFSFCLAAGSMIGSLIFWRLGLRSYSSASA